ncbi:unnamed protein product [Ceratitis capitata]|uniref:(Mediterranean fruit fly) hypothetical protein n=1 Tax=Ceratitis capitata TaxID=7213 RepID=A0A811UL88_CERCA|nr:unnamed protein product [Ceratitis capitata]
MPRKTAAAAAVVVTATATDWVGLASAAAPVSAPPFGINYAFVPQTQQTNPTNQSNNQPWLVSPASTQRDSQFEFLRALRLPFSRSSLHSLVRPSIHSFCYFCAAKFVGTSSGGIVTECGVRSRRRYMIVGWYGTQETAFVAVGVGFWCKPRYSCTASAMRGISYTVMCSAPATAAGSLVQNRV